MASIVTRNGADPLKEWRARLAWLDSPELTDAVRRLLSGDAVDTKPGSLEISWQPIPNRIRLTLRRPGAPYAVDLDIEAAGRDVVLPDRDSRETSPWPDRWQRPMRPGVVRWQLFNAVVFTVTTRRDA